MHATTQTAQELTRLFLVDAATTAAHHLRDTAMNDMRVLHVQTPEPYREDPMFCQVYVLGNSELTEEALDQMLWAHNVDYVGVVRMTCH